MELVIGFLKLYFCLIIIIMLIYTLRHFIFSYSRLFGQQRISYRDIYDSNMPTVSILVPMHNEEKVAKQVIEDLLKCDYDRDKLEIIVIDDHSEDDTPKIIDEYFYKYPFIKPIHRTNKNDIRGKAVGLNDALKIAKSEIIIVFDADYRPSRNIIKKLAKAFLDPQVGAVMGRVIPINAKSNMLTTLLNLERIGGYQVDQQARYNLKLLPQYGGTVGGFRKSIVINSGGFDSNILAEDTELTYRIFLDGWHVIYDNSAECYEESPETWKVRGKQVRRWSRGHNQVMFKFFFKFLLLKKITLGQRIDGILLMLVYFVPFLLALGHIDCITLFFLGKMDIIITWWAVLFVGAYNTWGNFAPFYEIGSAAFIDGITNELLALPLLCFSFYFYMWHISLGVCDAIVDLITRRKVSWVKTERFSEKSEIVRN